MSKRLAYLNALRHLRRAGHFLAACGDRGLELLALVEEAAEPVRQVHDMTELAEGAMCPPKAVLDRQDLAWEWRVESVDHLGSGVYVRARHLPGALIAARIPEHKATACYRWAAYDRDGDCVWSIEEVSR